MKDVRELAHLVANLWDKFSPIRQPGERCKRINFTSTIELVAFGKLSVELVALGERCNVSDQKSQLSQTKKKWTN